jgi:hypothetical protein
MRTSILAVALLAIAPVMARAQDPTFMTDYSAAQQRATTQQKPLALVFGQGAEGYQRLTGAQQIPAEASRILAQQYVSCYIDTSTPAGQALARQCGINRTVGLVISDRTGKFEALCCDGNCTADTLTTYLTRYADPERVFNVTDTIAPDGRISNYPPTGTILGNVYAPTLGYGGYTSYYPAYYGGYSGCSSYGYCGYSYGCGYRGCGRGRCR